MLGSTASLFLTSASWVGTPGDHDTYHSKGRHGAKAEAFCSSYRAPIVVSPGDGVLVAHPDGRAIRAVLVKLP